MLEADETALAARSKPRVIKPPAVRRAELIDCAHRLFLEKGYERTTINDVIAATALSKGAFYHHFRAKEDLLEAIAARFSEQAVGQAAGVQGDASLNALQRLNLLLAATREWKGDHLPELRAMFTTLLRPDNAVLYHRIVGAVFEAMAPTLTAVIEAGQADGMFDVADAGVAAEALLWLGEGRRSGGGPGARRRRGWRRERRDRSAPETPARRGSDDRPHPRPARRQHSIGGLGRLHPLDDGRLAGDAGYSSTS